MKIIELLNKIANGEEAPKKIKYNRRVYEYQTGSYDYFYIVENNGTMLFLLSELFNSIDNILDILNFEVEIIEDTSKKIKKIEKWFAMNVDEFLPQRIDEYNLTTANIVEKLNEIIDYINEGKNV